MTLHLISFHSESFRTTQLKGYIKPNSILKISEYPLAWFYSLNTSKETQEGVAPRYFRLPKGNLYVKGVSRGDNVGSFGEQQLLEHSHNYTITSLNNNNDKLKSRLNNHQQFSGHLFHSVQSTSASGMATNEVNRIHLLEGYYVGE